MPNGKYGAVRGELNSSYLIGTIYKYPINTYFTDGVNYFCTFVNAFKSNYKMSTQAEVTYCNHCKSKLQGNFCAECGQPKTLKRIDRKQVLEEIGNLINLKKGFLYTVKEVLIRPGKTIRRFISEDRRKLVKPIPFTIFCMLIYTIVMNVMGVEFNESVGVSSGNHSTWFYQPAYQMLNFLTEHLNLLILGSGFFMAWILKGFFKSYGYNFYELLTLSYYVMGVYTLISTFLFAIYWMWKLPYMDSVSTIIELSYIGWAVGQFFDMHKKTNYLKGLLSFMLSIGLTLVSIASLTIIYAVVRKFIMG